MQSTIMAAQAARDRTADPSRGIDNPNATQDDGTTLRPDLVISVQPQTAQDGSRAVLPVPTTDWRTNQRGQFIPINGLDFLIGVSTLVIQQTVDLHDLTSKIESENRYIVRVPNGEALYIANEASNASQRCFCGSGRAFVMHVHDNTRQEALQLRRRLAGASCCFPCRLQEMQVITPPGDYLGRIQQRWTFVVPFYLVRDSNDDVLYVIEGPTIRPCSNVVNAQFKIMSGDALREEGSIVHGWDREIVNFTTTLNMPEGATQPRHKALLLGATFLMVSPVIQVSSLLIL